MNRFSSAPFAFALVTTPVFAQEVTTEPTEDPSRCEMIASWGDIEDRESTVMIIRQDQDEFDTGDNVIVAFANDDWSIAPDDKLGVIKVENENGGWFSNEAIAMERAFLIWSEFDHISNVFDDFPTSVVITRGGKTIDRLNVTTLFTDWMDFKRCRQKKVDVKAEQERKEKLRKEIPRDPFAQ